MTQHAHRHYDTVGTMTIIRQSKWSEAIKRLSYFVLSVYYLILAILFFVTIIFILLALPLFYSSKIFFYRSLGRTAFTCADCLQRNYINVRDRHATCNTCKQSCNIAIERVTRREFIRIKRERKEALRIARALNK